MAGLSNEGFEVKRLEDIIADLKRRAEQIFGDVVPAGDTVDTGENTALGRMISVLAPSQADLWQAAQEVYDAFNPAAASGIALDNMVALAGISRFGSRPTIAQCIFEGSFGSFVGTLAKARSAATQKTYTPTSPVYFSLAGATGIGVSVLTVQNSAAYTIRYSNDGGINYTTFTITSDSTATAEEITSSLMSYINANAGAVVKAYMKNSFLYVERLDPFQTVTFEVSNNLVVNKVLKLGVVACDEIGPIEEQANTITLIAVPQSGWDSIYNPLKAETGRVEETDVELRERFRNTKFTQAANIIESISSEIASVEGVEKVVVYENDGDTVDSKGIPAHSFMPIVLGGLTTEIGNAIWKNKPMGIKSYGNTTVSILDSQGLSHNVSFKRPTPVRIYISMSLATDSNFPGAGPAMIKQALVDYFQNNYSVGDDIIYTRLYTPINSIAGHQVNSLTIGTSASPTGMVNIPINYDQIYSLSQDDITITLA
jgi:uncharacterized phage protein gp47/JayE